MEHVSERIKGVLNEIISIKGVLIVQRATVAEVSRKQDNVTKSQEEKGIELEKREAAIKPIEDIVAFKAAAEEVVKVSDQGRIVLENEKNKFESFMREENATLATRKADVAKLEALYKRELEALNKAKEEVAKEMASVKGKVLGELAKNV